MYATRACQRSPCCCCGRCCAMLGWGSGCRCPAAPGTGGGTQRRGEASAMETHARGCWIWVRGAARCSLLADEPGRVLICKEGGAAVLPRCCRCAMVPGKGGPAELEDGRAAAGSVVEKGAARGLGCCRVLCWCCGCCCCSAVWRGAAGLGQGRGRGLSWRGSAMVVTGLNLEIWL